MPTQCTTFDARPFLRAIDGDATVFVSLATDFLDTFHDQVAALLGAARAGDRPSLREVAHSLRGSLALFRADDLVGKVDAVVTSAAQPLPECTHLLPLLRSACDFAEDLRALCERLSRVQIPSLGELCR